VFSLAVGLNLATPWIAQAARITHVDSASTEGNETMSSVEASLQAGLPVGETRTATFDDGGTQTENQAIIPGATPGTDTTYKTINLRGGGLETVVDVAAAAGNATTHNITTKLPDGSTQNEHVTDVRSGPTTQINGTIDLPGGGTKTVVGDVVRHGPESVSDETITGPGSAVQKDHNVIVRHGQTSQSEVSTITRPDGAVDTSRSNTVITRTTPPPSSAQARVLWPAIVNNAESSLKNLLSPATVGLNGLNLTNLKATFSTDPFQAPGHTAVAEAQVIEPSADGIGTPLPSPIPEPSGLLVYALVIGLAGLKQGVRRLERKDGAERFILY
jgi:hypothetical protein